MLMETRYEHIVLKDGIARIGDTRYKVIHLAAEKLAYGWSAEEMQYQHPDLTLGQIYSALAYYADHEAEINRQLEEDAEEYERLRAASMNSPLRQKLRAKGLIP
jgi:uncharacterized protein (DUF433 family)